MDEKNNPVLSRTKEVIINGNKFIVTTHYKENGRETAEQKLFRYVSDRIAGDLKTIESAVFNAFLTCYPGNSTPI